MRLVYVLSLLLFNIYLELLFREALEEIEDNIKIYGEYLNNVNVNKNLIKLTLYLFILINA